MKVLLSSASYTLTDYFSAGEGSATYSIISHLREYGCLFYAVAANVMIRKKLENAKIYEVKVPIDEVRTKSSITRKSSELYYLLRSYCISRKVLKREKIDLVHHMFPATVGNSFDFLPLLSNVHPFVFGPICTDIPVTRNIYRRFVSRLHLETLKKCDAIVVQRPDIKDIYSQKIDTSKISVIPLCVDLKLFKPHNNLIESNEILTVASLNKNKGLDYLIKALAKISRVNRSVKLRIVGEGPEKHNLVQLVERLGIQKNVIFEGRVNKNRLPRFFQQADVFCLPSIYEAFGMVIIEAMACKKPVVATNAEGPSQIIDHMKNGIIVPVADYHSMAEAIVLLLDDESFRRKIGEAGRKKVVEKYSCAKVSQQYYKLYKDLLN